MAQPVSDPLSRAAELLRSGYKEEARGLLVGFLKQNPNSAKGWWLMSFAVDDLEQQVSCVKRVLLLQPGHGKAQDRLDALTGEVSQAKSGAARTARPAQQKKKLPLSLPAIGLLVVFGCVGFLVIGYFGYKIFFPTPPVAASQPVIAQNPADSATQPATLEPSATWTSTPTVQPSATPTVFSGPTATPLISSTPTIDPNATPTPIPESQIGIANGQYPPDFTLVDALSGQDISLSDYANQPVLIIFLTTWCTYCEQEMPGVQAVYEKYQEQGFVVLGVGIGASRAALRTYAGRFGITFPLLSDWEHDVARLYAANSIPTNYFVRKSGKIWQVSVGMLEEDELDTVIASVLKVP